MVGGKWFEKPLHRLAQRFIGGRHACPYGIAAGWRGLDAVQDTDARRWILEGGVGVPDVDVGRVVVVVYHQRYQAVAIHAAEFRV